MKPMVTTNSNYRRAAFFPTGYNLNNPVPNTNTNNVNYRNNYIQPGSNNNVPNYNNNQNMPKLLMSSIFEVKGCNGHNAGNFTSVLFIDRQQFCTANGFTTQTTVTDINTITERVANQLIVNELQIIKIFVNRRPGYVVLEILGLSKKGTYSLEGRFVFIRAFFNEGQVTQKCMAQTNTIAINSDNIILNILIIESNNLIVCWTQPHKCLDIVRTITTTTCQGKAVIG
ncbi:uncharacterized protein LOC128959304 [Oppia nitens]|uniref:uncharacterized protein LOC128959304 n=1 Tax=Oppia nitens TaxID=1686743 RepID=UPI0023DBF35C|nr:uncharacterized protein LOC128959304 [Oppia nitens]